LKENIEGLKEQVKRGNTELKTMMEDKQTYKKTLDFIVKTDKHAKKTLVKNTIALQKQIKREQNKIIALERGSLEYENEIGKLTQEKQDLEERNSQLRESALKDQEKINYLQEEYRAKVTETTDEISSLNIKLRLQTQETQQLLENKALYDKKAAEMTEEMDKVIKQLDQERTAKEKQQSLFEEERAQKVIHDEKMAEIIKDNERLTERISQLERKEETVRFLLIIFM